MSNILFFCLFIKVYKQVRKQNLPLLPKIKHWLSFPSNFKLTSPASPFFRNRAKKCYFFPRTWACPPLGPGSGPTPLCLSPSWSHCGPWETWSARRRQAWSPGAKPSGAGGCIWERKQSPKSSGACFRTRLGTPDRRVWGSPSTPGKKEDFKESLNDRKEGEEERGGIKKIRRKAKMERKGHVLENLRIPRKESKK